MSIRLVMPIQISGVHYAAGQTVLSLSAALESDLVAQGKAIWVESPFVLTDVEAHAKAHAAIASSRSYGGGRFEFERLLPVHDSIVDPDTLSGLPLTAGNITVSYDATEKERSAGSLKIAVATSVTAALSPRVPIPASNGFAKYPKLNARVHLRIKCSDWTKVTRLYVNFAQDAGTTNYQLNIVDGSQENPQGIHSGFDAVWSGQYRTIIVCAEQALKQAGASAWCDYNVPGSEYTTDGLFFSLTTTGAVNFWIDRIYSPRWPVGFLTLIGDGAYQSFRDLVVPEFNARNWRLGTSLYLGTATGIYPSEVDLLEIARHGHDVFPHLFHTDTASAFSSSTTKADVKKAFQNQERFLSAVKRENPQAMRWCQFLQNSGRISTSDLNRLLETMGIAACRGDVADDEYGVDPFIGASQCLSTYNRSKYSTSIGGWCSIRGKYNRAYAGAYWNLGTPELRNTYSGSPLQKGVEFCANHADGMLAYVHQVVPYDGTQPDSNNIGKDFWHDWLADLDAKVSSGKLLILSPTEVEMLTYWRHGEVFMRWDGEWVFRHDPTKIAF